MTTTTSNRVAAQKADPQQLRDDLLVLRRITGKDNRAAPASLTRNLNMARRIAQYWSPLAHALLDTAAGWPTEQRRWEHLISRVHPGRPVGGTCEAVSAYAGAVRELLQAVQASARPGTSGPEVIQAITAALSKGEYPVGWSLRITQVAADLGAPAEAVTLAVNALVDSRALEVRGQRVFPAGSQDVHRELTHHIADRLRAQIAFGIYPPGTRLPTTRALAVAFCSDSAPIAPALRILAAEGLLHLGRSGAEVRIRADQLLPPLPAAQPPSGSCRFSRDDIVITCRTAHVQWHRRARVGEAELRERWQDLRSMAGQLLAAAPPPASASASRLTARARARELAGAPLPTKPWLQLWHTACLAGAVSSLLPYLPQDGP